MARRKTDNIGIEFQGSEPASAGETTGDTRAAEYHGIPIVEPESGEPVRESAGRSDSDGPGNDGATDSGPIGVEFDPEPVRRRRGRQPGTKNKPKTETVQGSLAGIQSLLTSVHMMGAAMLSCPELVLGDDESKMLTEAIGNVAKHYPVGMSEKSLAWANLFTVAGGIYGTRLFAIKMRKDEEKKRKPKLVQPIAEPIGATPKPTTEAPKPKPNGAPQPNAGIFVQPATQHWQSPPSGGIGE